MANFATRLLNFLILPMYTYYLSTEEYATIDLMNTTIQLVYPLFTLAIVDAVLRFAISKKEKVGKILTTGLIVIGIGFVVLTIGCIGINIYIKDVKLISCFLLVYLTQTLNNLAGTVSKVLDKTKEMAIITTVTSFLILLLNILMVAVLKQGVIGYWVANIVGNLLGLLLYIVLCKLYKTVERVGKAEIIYYLKPMLVYSIPLIPNALFWWVNSSLDRWTLTFLEGLAVVGLYSCANKIPTILSTINTIFSQAWNLSIFQNYNTVDGTEFYNNVYYYFNEILFCCCIGIIMMSKVIGDVMFAKDFGAAWIYIPLLTAGLYYNCINSFLGSLFTASKQTKYIFTTTLAGTICNLVLNFPMVYILGASGAALATLISYLLVYGARCIKVRKLYGIVNNRKKIGFQMCFLGIETIFVMKNRGWGIVICMVGIYCLKFLITMCKEIKAVKR
ncbi:MATE efflux family protein [uncultured Clostridium sp.]|nr:MATE efflux family protein [uncultured Clostridium sp.]